MKTRLFAVTAMLALGAMACARRSQPAEAPGPLSSRDSAELSRDIARLAEDSDSSGIADLLRARCRHPETRSQCFEAQLAPLAGAGKVRVAMGALDRLATLEPAIRVDGHVYAHAIGIAAGKSTGDVAAAFSQCSEAFQSGCYHGVIQAWFGRHGAIGEKEANELCEPFRKNESQRWIRFQCVHGMGHGLTMLHGHDLTAGLKDCDLLTDPWDEQSCYGGAFMENIVSVTNPHHPASALSNADTKGKGPPGGEHDAHADHDPASGKAPKENFKAVDPANQQYPCSIMPERYLRACYEMQTSVMLHNNGGDIAGAAKSCGDAPVAMRVVCIASLGRDISSYSQQHHGEAIRMCSFAPQPYQPWCYFGVVKNFIDINARAEEGIAFCRDVPGAPNKEICYSAVGEQVLILAPEIEDRRRLCMGAEVEYLDTCLYSARVRTDPPAELLRVIKSLEQ